MAALAQVCGCGPSMAQMRILAERAELQPDAPIQASARAVIEAPIAEIWRLLSEVDGWPAWNDDARGAKLQGAFEAGSLFEYGVSTRHHLILGRVQPPDLFSFYGTLVGYKGITVWQCEAVSPARTRVTVRESSDGPLISMVYSARQLEEHLQGWVASLQTAAERAAPTTRPVAAAGSGR